MHKPNESNDVEVAAAHLYSILDLSTSNLRMACTAADTAVQCFAAPSTQAPAAIGPYSQATAIGNTVYVSGCIGLLPGDTKQFASESVVGQTEQALTNMAAILEAAGSGMGLVAKTTVLLTDMANYAAVRMVLALLVCVFW
jgi:reactive intermediate/imine deaminase